MIKTFVFGILLGLAVAVGALYALPPVDQHRESSIISVAPNGGNTEIFHVEVPTDRILVGGSQHAAVPADVMWPEDEILAGVSTELYKLRNAQDAVVGIAARTAAAEENSAVLDWVVHLPARGSLYVSMDSTVAEQGYRIGEIQTGSREFASLSGVVSERWIADTSGESDAPDGRIELAATYVSNQEPVE